MDHYQTPREVYVSVFAKQSDKDNSKVVIEEDKVNIDLFNFLIRITDEVRTVVIRRLYARR